jgi:hypothetical protein
MGYKESLKLAGAVVHDYQEFGSYQGDWWAYVTYEGTTGWIHDYFGSCSGCDAFQGEFGYDLNHYHKDKYFSAGDEIDFDLSCPQCQIIKQKMIDFGKSYLENILNQDQAEEDAGENLAWDMDATEMLNFVKSKRVKQ